jgi:MFS family permease
MSVQESNTVNIAMKDVAPPPAHRELHDPTAPTLVDEKGEPTYLDHEGRFIERNPSDHRKLMWRIDLHVIPWIAVLYFLAFLDRVNIGNARLFGLETDTGLHGSQYNIALLLFFIPYILFEVPSNLLLKKMRPKIWLPCISLCGSLLTVALMLGWGLVTMFMGWTHNLSGLIACRFFLGVFEAGLLPGCVYVISMWYKRHEGIFPFFFL